MSERQARLLAASGEIRSINEGQALVTKGDPASEMFIVLDGSFRVWDPDSVENETIVELARGSTIGEIGFFAARRAASVTALQSGRVLVLNASVLERLRRRDGALAALAYLNLNRIQAARGLATA